MTDGQVENYLAPKAHKILSRQKFDTAQKPVNLNDFWLEKSFCVLNWIGFCIRKFSILGAIEMIFEIIKQNKMRN